MPSHTNDNLQEIEQYLGMQSQPGAYFYAGTVAHHAGDTEKATRYLRLALNAHTSDLVNSLPLPIRRNA